MEDKDLQIDNIIDLNKPKKKVDGKSKGNRTELHLCKILTEHFGTEFTRALGSGNRWSQVNFLPDHAKQTLTGDICVPEDFKWVIESKGGYEDEMNLTNVLDGNVLRLDSFIEQVTKDAAYCKRRPIILWKRNRKPWLAALQTQYFSEMIFTSRIIYGEWAIVNFETLLKLTTKDFWFNK